MTNFKLHLPKDIPWKRVCVTEDMMDPVVCDEGLPAKWQTSMAVFKYKPEDNHQVYPQYDITYLKVTASITGYQPLDKEIQGKIDWYGVNTETQITNEILKDLLNSYHPCMGAILQVEVGPPGQNPNIPLIDYPFFMDFEPKKRERFEMITDEKSTHSPEDSSAETSQIAQTYNLLNSYHLGTNRAVFLIQSRPYSLNESNGFVRGPGSVDGIQEFFMIVAQPKGQNDFCVSLRLDTSHLIKTPVIDYERKIINSGSLWAIVPKPNDFNNPGEPYEKAGIFTEKYEFHGIPYQIEYQCYRAHYQLSKTIDAPDGFIIEDYEDMTNTYVGNANSNVSISNDRKSLTISAEAKGGYCGAIYFGEEYVTNEEYAWAQREINITYRSIQPTVQIGEKEVLLITTRGLCCCPSEGNKTQEGEFVMKLKAIPDNLSPAHPDSQYTARLANELGDFIKTETIKSLNNPSRELKKYYETDFFFNHFEYNLLQTPFGKRILTESVSKDVPKEIIPKLEKHFGRKCKEISKRELLSLQGDKLSKLTGEKPEDIQKLKLKLMGVKFKSARKQKK